jgi:hypothetical protein
MYCCHILSLFNYLQIKGIEQLKPFLRWTKAIQAEHYAKNNPQVMPISPQEEARLAMMQGKPIADLHNQYQ